VGAPVDLEHGGTAAHSIKPAMPARMASGRWMAVGAESWELTRAAQSAPMACWPSTPRLNSPALKATPTARPAKISGVARPRMNATELRLNSP
jgi:hypothetical protein